MCTRTVRTLGLHDCDSVFKILMYHSPHIYMCIFVRLYFLFPAARALLHFSQGTHGCVGNLNSLF